MSFSSKCTIKRFGGRALLDSGHLALFRWWGSQREGKEGKGKEGGQGEEKGHPLFQKDHYRCYSYAPLSKIPDYATARRGLLVIAC